MKNPIAIFVLVPGVVWAASTYVPPPAAPIKDGAPVKVEMEVTGSSHIIHIARQGSAGYLYGQYLAVLERHGEHEFRADLSTRGKPFSAGDEELLFVTISPGEESQYTLTIVDPTGGIPWKRVFSGSLGNIPHLAE